LSQDVSSMIYNCHNVANGKLRVVSLRTKPPTT
jgi:hypothetical protein